ncbi:hypothetical protein SAMN05421737_105136 [Shouchella lonarensis]|uniref:Uncharacterized protein n=1 Tax=Shouchella lonarensis TaxID=1464122 RepID=A0A1G6IQD4_9BACI|nr:hypothetical protein SAMN05421737_105136 [Shouchella lonarensis]
MFKRVLIATDGSGASSTNGVFLSRACANGFGVLH